MVLTQPSQKPYYHIIITNLFNIRSHLHCSHQRKCKAGRGNWGTQRLRAGDQQWNPGQEPLSHRAVKWGPPPAMRTGTRALSAGQQRSSSHLIKGKITKIKKTVKSYRKCIIIIFCWYKTISKIVFFIPSNFLRRKDLPLPHWAYNPTQIGGCMVGSLRMSAKALL